MPSSGAAAEYYRVQSKHNGIQYFRIGDVQSTRQEAEENRLKNRRDTEIVDGPEDSLQPILGEGDVFELRGLPIPEEPIAAS